MAKIIGIDLGTTNSLVAVMEGGSPQVISNSEGSFLTPSVVGFTKTGERLVGELAKRQSISNPERTVGSIKRQMGTEYAVTIDDRKYTPPEISSMILRKLKADAESYLSEPLEKAVITVPAYFNDAERQATKDAGTLAGLEVVRIINEPTAAAMAYGLDKMQGTQNILVFDLGGGTFDVSILTIENGVFEVIATCGDMKLGGDDWDRRIMDYLVDDFKKIAGIDLRVDRVAMQRLKDAAEAAKWELSEKETARINLPFIGADPSGPKHLDMEFKRQKLEELTRDLVDRLSVPAQKALDDSKLPLAQIHKIVLVGGSTRMPMVQRLVEKLFRKEPSVEVDPEKVVAAGAAIQAAILAGEVKDLVLLDVSSLSLGIETTGGVFTRVIERNTQIPCSKRKIFTTVANGQTTVEVRVYQGERELTQHNRFLGSFELRNIPPASRGIPQIEVSFEIDANGIVSASATDLATNNKQKITIQSPTNLSHDELNRLLQEAKDHYDVDLQSRKERQIRNKAQVEIDVAERTLHDYGRMFAAEETTKVKTQINSIKNFMEKAEFEKVALATIKLQEIVFVITEHLYESARVPKSSSSPADLSLEVVEPHAAGLSSARSAEEEVAEWMKKQPHG